MLLYYVNGLNIIRRDFGDFDDVKDWLQPFMKSMLIWDEDIWRGKMDLPSLLPNSLDALEHSTFMNMVVNGFKNPYFEWEKAYGELAKEGARQQLLKAQQGVAKVARPTDAIK